MSAILPPGEKLWWKQPLDRVEGMWILIAFAWCMVMFFMMPYWHVYGKQNLSTETYKVKPCLLYTSPSPRDRTRSRMPSSA